MIEASSQFDDRQDCVRDSWAWFLVTEVLERPIEALRDLWTQTVQVDP